MGGGQGDMYVCIHVSSVIRPSCGLESVVRRGSELAQISLTPPRFHSFFNYQCFQACRASSHVSALVNLHMVPTTFIIPFFYFFILSYINHSGVIYSLAITVLTSDIELSWNQDSCCCSDARFLKSVGMLLFVCVQSSV